MSEPQDTVERLGLKVRAEFVPFSKSRNAANADKSLNWRVTLTMQRGLATAPTDVLTTDYSAGIGHCPSYKIKAPDSFDKNPKRWQSEVCAFECEHGKKAGWGSLLQSPYASASKIEPNALDVIHSLVLDAETINYRSFDDWAESFDYDSDSRKAESIYRACLEVGLTLRNTVSDAAMVELQTAFQDY
jgi:hypothetical protein